MSGAHTEREILIWQSIEDKGYPWFLDSAHNCCRINEARHRMERGQHFLWTSDTLPADWKYCPGPDGGPIPFRNGVQPRTWFLRIQEIKSFQPTVVRLVQYKCGRWRSNWRDLPTQGTPGVCGAGAIHSNLPWTDGGRTASHTWGRRRAVPFLRFPEAKWPPTWKSDGGPAEWLHHQGQTIHQEPPTDSAPPRQVHKGSCAKDNKVQRNCIFARW